MREIKFRAWDKNNKEMLKVERLWWEDVHQELVVQTTQYTDYFNTKDMILMQFTDLYDKNGKEIYEGDIVKINGEEIMYCRYKAGCGAFEFSLSKELLGHTLEGLFKRLNIEALIFEVIGNVWENEGLLNDSK